MEKRKEVAYLFRNSYLNYENKMNYLIYSFIYLDNIKRMSIEDIKRINNDSKRLNKYALMYINDEKNEKKYIHINNNENVTISSEPTCFIDARIILLNRFNYLKRKIEAYYSKSKCNKKYGELFFEIVGSEECKNIFKSL